MKKFLYSFLVCIVFALPLNALAETYNPWVRGCKDGQGGKRSCEMGKRVSFTSEIYVSTVNSTTGGAIDIYSSWGKHWHWEFGKCDTGDYSCERNFKISDSFEFPSSDYNQDLTIIGSGNLVISIPYPIMDGFDPIDPLSIQ